MQETTGRVSYAQNIQDPTLDRSYEYDHVGRLAISHSGAEARAHAVWGQWGIAEGPYSQGYDYDPWGNVTHKYGWGGEVQGGGAGQSSDIYYSYTGNRRTGSTYDAAGNLKSGGNQTFSYDATGQQTYAASQGGGGGAPVFTDNPLESGMAVRAIHITELRTAINQVRAGVGQAGYAWQYSATTNDWISANPILEMRTALDQALGAPPAPGYAAGLAQGQPIKKDHIQELRNRVTAALAGQSSATLSQSYDGAGLRVKKTENGATTWYLRSSVLGGQVIAEINGSGGWQRGFVYAGSSLLAVQQGGVFWMHEDPITKSKRVTNSAGTVVSWIETDPWGADTNRSSNAAFQPKKFTSYDRDSNGSDEAMFRRFNRKHSRFDQPDPYDGSYSFSDPQSFNRYAYVQNDPVNFVDPSGLTASFCGAEFSYADCGGDAGFWGAGGGGSGGGGGGFGGDVAEYNREYGGMPQGVATALHLHSQRVNNDRGGYGFITNEEVRRIVANAFIRDPETGQLVHAGGAVWVEDTPWHERGAFGQIGLGARGFADALTMGLVSWAERRQGRLSPAEEEWLANSDVHNAGGWVGVAGGLIIPGPGKFAAPLKHAKLIKNIVRNASKPGVTLSEAKIAQLARVVQTAGGSLRTEVGRQGSVNGVLHSHVLGFGSRVGHRHIIHLNQVP